MEEGLYPEKRGVRSILRKVEKVLDVGAAERAVLIAENNRLREEQRPLRPYSKRKVRKPPNDKFARIEDIVAVEEASRKAPKRRRASDQPAEEPVAEDVQEMIIVGLGGGKSL